MKNYFISWFKRLHPIGDWLLCCEQLVDWGLSTHKMSIQGYTVYTNHSTTSYDSVDFAAAVQLTIFIWLRSALIQGYKVRDLCVSTILCPFSRTIVGSSVRSMNFILQKKVINTETQSWSVHREQETLQHPSLNGTSMTHFSPRLKGILKQGQKDCNSLRQWMSAVKQCLPDMTEPFHI